MNKWQWRIITVTTVANFTPTSTNFCQRVAVPSSKSVSISSIWLNAYTYIYMYILHVCLYVVRIYNIFISHMGLSENRVPQTPRVNGVSPIRPSCRFEALTGSLWARSKQCLGRAWSRGVDRNLAWPFFRVYPINPQLAWQLKLLELPAFCFFRSHCGDSAPCFV